VALSSALQAVLTPWTPAKSKALLWFKADDLANQTMDSSNNVSQIRNKGPQGGSVDGVTTARPVWTANHSPNGKPAWVANGTSNKLTSATNLTFDASTMFIGAVASRTAGASAYRELFGIGTGSSSAGASVGVKGGAANGWNTDDLVFTGGNGYGSGQTPKIIVSGGANFVADATWHVLSATIGLSNTVRVDRAVKALGLDAPADFAAMTMAVTLFNISAAGGDYWQGDLGELVMIPDPPANMAQLWEAYVLREWAV
jgi:hypothetical protein